MATHVHAPDTNILSILLSVLVTLVLLKHFRVQGLVTLFPLAIYLYVLREVFFLICCSLL